MPPQTKALRSENQPVDRFLRMAENAVYILAGVLLISSALIVLLVVGYHLVTELGKGVEGAVTGALDGLLLVFIVLELLAGIRATMVERQLVAEPFLVVGIIASIKEIIVITLRARTEEGLGDDAFGAAMVEIGVLGLLVLLLAAAAYLVRRKEREPDEATEHEQ
ncbi:MAG: phosphate-starvation-inducible PsiE family protein [Actinobacteria bacterium]|nr:phosphate-starvation-inducible PsiE family protein [Actinomycetota bacterium]MBW3650691.1 phosphate-starvation-inducible PsiE family protein [Actinomycetota bacterium]